MRGAHQSLLIALEWRRDGLDTSPSGSAPRSATRARRPTQAIQQIAGQMQVFLASDVAYETRVRPLIKAALDDAEVGGQDIAPSRFLPEHRLAAAGRRRRASSASSSVGAARAATRTSRRAPACTAPELDVGHLRRHDAAARRAPTSSPTRPTPTFSVKFVNGGENDEFDVKVTVKIEGGSGKPISVSDTIDQVAPGASATANLALEQSPPLGAAVTITVKVAPVPGEEKTDNNQAEYQAIFTSSRGAAQRARRPRRCRSPRTY